MKRKIGIFLVCMLFVLTVIPITITAGDPENPEVVDKVRDVIGFPQKSLRKIDISSAWFYEVSSNPDCLYISLKIVDLDAKINSKTTSMFTGFLKLIKQIFFKYVSYDTDSYQAIFAVEWKISNIYYSALVHENPDDTIYFWVGKSTDYDDDIDFWYDIDGTFDKDNNIITWVIPKDKIDNIHIGTKLTSIFPHTHFRHLDESGKEGPDLAKDLSWNAKVIKDYIIQY